MPILFVFPLKTQILSIFVRNHNMMVSAFYINGRNVITLLKHFTRGTRVFVPVLKLKKKCGLTCLAFKTNLCFCLFPATVKGLTTSGFSLTSWTQPLSKSF